MRLGIYKNYPGCFLYILKFNLGKPDCDFLLKKLIYILAISSALGNNALMKGAVSRNLQKGSKRCQLGKWVPRTTQRQMCQQFCVAGVPFCIKEGCICIYGLMTLANKIISLPL